MNFQEILELDTKIPVEDELMQVFHNIYQECQPFLKEVNHKPAIQGKTIMYRGMKDLTTIGPGLEDAYGIKTVRLDNRKPKDTPEEGHDSLNQYFEQDYGHPYRNGLFVTGNEMTAESYGMPYAIFPVGKFEYIWNKEIDDMTTEIYDYIEGTQDSLDHNTINEHPAWVQYYHAEMKTGKGEKYIPPNIPGIPPEKSSAVTLDQMYAFIRDKSDVDLIRFVMRNYGRYSSKNLQAAIADGAEIMIWCQEYYYMDPLYLDHFAKFISK